MVANILPTDTPSTQGLGKKVKLYIFSESSHVAYQIKADDAGSNMVANILLTDTPTTPGVGSKGQTISFTESSHVAYQRELSTEHHESKYAVIIHTNDPWGGGQKVIFCSFLKVVMLHVKVKWKKCRPTCKVTL